jgi:hypothetical protein
VSQAGAVLLVDAIRAAGMDAALSAALQRWRKPTAVHDPGKILLDVAVSLALGGDCLADVATLRDAPAVFGRARSIRELGAATDYSIDRVRGLLITAGVAFRQRGGSQRRRR